MEHTKTDKARIRKLIMRTVPYLSSTPEKRPCVTGIVLKRMKDIKEKYYSRVTDIDRIAINPFTPTTILLPISIILRFKPNDKNLAHI